MSDNTKNQTVFYGWFVVAACFSLTLILGGTGWSFGVFFKPLENDFGWSRTLISSGFTAFWIGNAISVMIGGRLADKYNPRPILLTCALLVGLGVSLCSQIHSINQLRIFLFIAGLGAGANWSVPSATIQRWFHERQKAGLALGIVVSGVGVGALIFAPLINHLIISYGWRSAYLITGLLFFSIIVASSLVVKRGPTEVAASSKQETSTLKSVSTQGWVTRRVVTNPAFIGITFTVCATISSFHVLSVHLIPQAIDVGISPTAAATAVGLMGGVSVPGRIMGGLISDRIDWQKMLAIATFGMGLSIIWLIFLKATWMLYGFVFFYGVCHGSRVPAQVGIIGEFFGIRSLGELIGITTAISILVGAFAPYMAGFIFDTTGGYLGAFIVVLVLLLSGGFIATLIKKPSITPR